jgi:hypothetical protein
MAIMPHCVVCGFSGAAEVAGSVEFADYIPSSPPSNADGIQVIGWSNSLGVTAPEGVGLFCREHLTRATKLRRLTAAEAVEAIRTGADRRGGLRAGIRGFFSSSTYRRVSKRPNGIGTTP